MEPVSNALEFWKNAAETHKHNNLKLLEEIWKLQEEMKLAHKANETLSGQYEKIRDHNNKQAQQLQSIQQERDEELLFPRQADRIGDWVISPNHLEEVARNIENYHGYDAPDYTPSWEQIEMVLLAVERMAKSE